MLHIGFEKYTLENGMRVILAPDASAPVVALYLVYNVGARSEEPGRTGFAHLFEHMMFQGSTHAPKGFHFQQVESNGGSMNGSTHPDYTDYFEMLPSNKLPVALWLESDRMRGLAVNQENLDNQRAAVKEEKRLSFDNQPYNSAIVDVWPQVVYRNWSNSHSLIGSYEDLDAANVEDVARFFRTYYAPNNSVLAIAGDIDPAETRMWIEQYFGDIPPQPLPPRPDLREPEPREGRAEAFADRLARVPAVLVGWAGPERRSPDFYALTMLDVVLTAGDSSRFQQNLVKKAQSVIQYEGGLGWPFAGFTDYKSPGALTFFFLHNPAFEGSAIVAQVQAEVDRVAEEGVPGAEFERARTYLKASRISGLQTVLSRAKLLAQYELLDGDPGLLNTELDRFLAVTPAEVQAAARQYLTRARRSVLAIVPTPPEEEPAEELEEAHS